VRNLKGLALYWIVGAILLLSMHVAVTSGHRTAVSLALRAVTLTAIVSPTDARYRGWSLAQGFDVTAQGIILVRDGGSIFNAVTGEVVLKEPNDDLVDFLAIGNGVVAICGRWLCSHNNGRLEPNVALPSDHMALAATGNANSIYLYESAPNGSDLYLVNKGGGYVKLAHINDAIFSAVGIRDRVFAASGSKVITFRLGSDPATIVDFGHTAPVVSLAADAEKGIVYLSAGEGVFAIAESNIFPVLVGMTGDLRFSGGVLFVADRTQKTLVAVSGASEAIIAMWRRANAPGRR
jgi:hypothetical protein